MIVSTVPALPHSFADRVGYLPSRAAAVTLPAPGGPLLVIGLYVPSRDVADLRSVRRRPVVAGPTN